MSAHLLPPCDETLAAASATKPCVSKTGVLIATIAGSSLAFVVGSVINVALPAMQASLQTDAAGAQWIINAYLLPVGALVLMGGALGDRYGRKLLFLGGLLVFAFACLGCALAPSLSWLLGARVLQGAGAAFLAPNSLAIIAASFDAQERGKAVGTWAAAGAIAGAIAPVLGGWLVDVASWRWAFAVVIPPAVIAFGVGFYAIAESRETEDAVVPLDWLGAATATVFLASSIWALIAFPVRGLSDPLVLAAIAIASTALVGFFVVEHRLGDAAMTPLSLFVAPTFAGVSLLTFLLYGALSGLLVLLPYVLIVGFGFTATEAGAAVLPFPVIMGTLSRYAGGLVDRIGARVVLTVGPIIVGFGFALFARLPAESLNYFRDVMPPLILIALGMAASVAPLTTTVMNSVSAKHVGVASGINNAVARGAGLVATAFLGFVIAGAAEDTAGLVDGFTSAALVGAVLTVLSALCAFALIRSSVVSPQA